MNIVEAYIKFKKQLIILISGLPGSGTLNLAKNIEKDFKLKLIDQNDYYILDYNVNVTLQNGITLINWYNDDSIEWNKLNIDINKYKSNGLVIFGISFPKNKIDADIDYHIHLNISKKMYMDKRKLFYEKNNQDYDIVSEKLKVNQLIYPYYFESLKNNKIDKFVDINELNDYQIYDNIFDILIDFINQYLIQRNNTKKTYTDSTPKVSKIDTDETISASLELSDTSKYSYDQDLDMISSLTDEDDILIKFVEL